MEVFQWNALFETGIASIDEQHKKLVEMINAMAKCEIDTSQGLLDLEKLIQALYDYAHMHFADEEALMAQYAIDSHHSKKHIQEHLEFVKEITSLSKIKSADPQQDLGILHRYLLSWLGFHILGTDQSLTRQIARIHSGMSPTMAFLEEAHSKGHGIEAMQVALLKLYEVAAERNKQLRNYSDTLESQVAARTAELEKANEALRQEQIIQTTLNEQIAQSQKQILQSEKMAAVGQLAAGVAHEINNPIGYVNSNLGTLKTYVARLLEVIEAYISVEGKITDSEALATLQSIKKAAELDYLQEDILDLLKESREGLDRVTKIVQDLKDFSHIDSTEFAEADLNKGLDSTLNVIWNEVKYKAKVVKDYGDLPRVNCVASQINQVFMNLIVNASHAIEESGTITLRTREEGDGVVIEIADTGKGIPLEIQRRIFEPFFTTKPVGKGTGLGLSLSHDIVKKHGGHIEVSSEPGVGTSFKVFLPLTPPTNTV